MTQLQEDVNVRMREDVKRALSKPVEERSWVMVIDIEKGKKWIRKKGKDEPPIETGRKCHFCLHRLNAGMVPACVTTCTGRAMYFGDLNDPQSLVAELLKNKPSYRVNESLGTKPRVYYLHSTYTEKELKEGCAACHE